MQLHSKFSIILIILSLPKIKQFRISPYCPNLFLRCFTSDSFSQALSSSISFDKHRTRVRLTSLYLLNNTLDIVHLALRPKWLILLIVGDLVFSEICPKQKQAGWLLFFSVLSYLFALAEYTRLHIIDNHNFRGISQKRSQAYNLNMHLYFTHKKMKREICSHVRELWHLTWKRDIK